MRALSLDQARRVAVRAQRLDRRRSTAPAVLLRHLGAVQIDSVNVVARAHYLPFYARLDGTREAVDRLFASKATTEYWAHEASLMLHADRELFGWRMRQWRDDAWSNALQAADEYPGLLEMVLAEVAAEPGTARQIEARLETDHPRDRSHWGWNWSVVKRVCEALFWAGRLTTTGRNSQFERIYTVGCVPEIDEATAARELVTRTVRACGVASRRTIRDYFRLSPPIVDLGIGQALSTGDIEPVAVGGDPWFGAPDLVVSRQDSGTALLAPFDPLLWDRDRIEHLFGFRYRIEIYTPQAKRQYGYYVLPFLLEGRLVARVDLKADRRRGVLLVRGAFVEPNAPGTVAGALRSELDRLGGWLGLTDVSVAQRGDLAARLT